MPKHLFLRGPIGIGKSTAIRDAVLDNLAHVGGFYVQRVLSNGQHAGFALNPLHSGSTYVLEKEIDSDTAERMFIIKDKNGFRHNLDVFAQVGVDCLRDNLKRCPALTVLDETGGIELLCVEFRDILYETLERLPCIGTVKSAANTAHMAKNVPRIISAKTAQDEYLHMLTHTCSSRILDMTEANRQTLRQETLRFVKACMQTNMSC